MTDDLTLLILAAGMGSRYGGLKQLDAVGPSGEVIMEYSIYDAMRAGVNRVVFVIRDSFEDAFRETILARLPSSLKVELAYQEFSDLPEGVEIDPSVREKPWGTAHAVWAARHRIEGPFIAINADDYYGQQSFSRLADHLRAGSNPAPAMVGFRLAKTLSPSGTVSRGVCQVDDGRLQLITECTELHRADASAVVDDATGKTYPDSSLVSMNCWGFASGFMDFIETEFRGFLEQAKGDPETLRRGECYLPAVVDSWRSLGRGDVSVLISEEEWLGVTYPEDKDRVSQGLSERAGRGVYPRELWA